MEFDKSWVIPWVWVGLGGLMVWIGAGIFWRRRKLAFTSCTSIFVLLVLLFILMPSYWGDIRLTLWFSYRNGGGGEPNGEEWQFTFAARRGRFSYEPSHVHSQGIDTWRINPGILHTWQDLNIEYTQTKQRYPDISNWRRMSHIVVDKAGAFYGWREPKDLSNREVWLISNSVLQIPGWWLAPMLTLCPIWWVNRCRLRRYPLGHCRKCGFDLRAHKPGEKCPECGTVVPTSREKPITGSQPPPS